MIVRCLLIVIFRSMAYFFLENSPTIKSNKTIPASEAVIIRNICMSNMFVPDARFALVRY